MSKKERIELVRDAINNTKKRIAQANIDLKFMQLEQLWEDLRALEHCYDIEVNAIIEQQAMADFEALLAADQQKDNVVTFPSLKKAA